MITMLAQAKIEGPDIDFAGLSPIIALIGGSVIVLLLGLFRSRPVREHLVPFFSLVAIGAALGLSVWQWGERADLIEGAMRLDELTLGLTILFCVAGIATVLLSWRHVAPRESAHGEYHALLLASLAGMVVLVGATDLITLFLGLELLSIPLYVLCATEMRREGSLESGLKYLIIGSVGSATLLFGTAFIYGAAGSTNFNEIAQAIGEDGIADSALLLTGVALAIVGLAFKASVAPFHQWTPDVYEGAPTPVTAFMAVATKAAAIGITLRLFDVALIGVSDVWQPAFAFLAAITIIVGNVGALGQSSLKRMLAYSGVAQAGYLLAGVVVASQAGVEAAVFYLAAYTVMNLAAFAVIIARQAERPDGDDLGAYRGLGTERPLLAWPLTLAMLGLAGFPLTAGFIGKFGLIQASVEGDYTWLGVMIVIGSMISLGYYLKVVAVMWMTTSPEPDEARTAGIVAGTPPVIAGGSPEADDARVPWEVVLVAVVFGALTLAIGVYPQPLFELAQDAAASLEGLL
ncbi:MAG: NADH-quinone oxidoreductase subunit N [Solirubrobacteraceae bacterium]|nr:NADH-quinone oxidoreductase subunit N [Solirubrobacteraceae bacterium]